MKTSNAGRPARNGKTSNTYVRARVTSDELEKFKEKSEQLGYKSVSDWIRSLMQAA